MRVERAIDAFLDWRRLERDATPRSVDSYWRILSKLSEEFPEAPLQSLRTADLRNFLSRRWGAKSASTRSNVISVLHSFFAWAEAEDLVDQASKSSPEFGRLRSITSSPRSSSWKA